VSQDWLPFAVFCAFPVIHIPSFLCGLSQSVSELDKFVRNDVPGIVTNVSQNMKGAYQKYEYFRNKRSLIFSPNNYKHQNLVAKPNEILVEFSSSPIINTNKIHGPEPFKDGTV
jgi:hypothetical protein